MRRILLALVLVFAGVLLSRPALSATPLFADGFESGTSSAWSECDNTIVASPVHSGTFGMRYNGQNQYLCIRSGVSGVGTTVYISFWNRWPTVTSGGWNHMWRLWTSGGAQMDCEWNRANGSSFQCAFLSFGNDFAITGGDPYTPHYGSGQWFRTELLITLNTPRQSNGTFKYWVNGVVWKNLTGQNLRGNSSAVFNEIYAISNFDASSPVLAYLDDVEWWTGCPPSGASCSLGTLPPPPPPPPPPTSGVAAPGVAVKGEAIVTWTWPTGATEVRVQRRVGADTELWKQIKKAIPPATAYTNHGLTIGTRYCYRLRGLTGGVLSPPSPESCMVP